MATVRRIALVLVLVLLITDGALLALVKMNHPKPGPGAYNLTAQEEKPAKVKAVKAALEKEGLTPAISEGTMKSKQVDGYRVVLRSAKAAVDPIAQELASHKIAAKKVEGGNALQLTKSFKSKKLAQADANKVSQYGFKVEENYKEIEVKCSKIELKNLDPEKAEKAEKIFTDNKVQVDKEAATPATPGATGTP